MRMEDVNYWQRVLDLYRGFMKGVDEGSVRRGALDKDCTGQGASNGLHPPLLPMCAGVPYSSR